MESLNDEKINNNEDLQKDTYLPKDFEEKKESKYNHEYIFEAKKVKKKKRKYRKDPFKLKIKYRNPK